MTIVFKVSDNIKEKMKEFYQDKRRSVTPPYAIFQAQEADTIITLYESGKAMFQGVSADIDANLWIDMERHLNHRVIKIDEAKKEKKETKDQDVYFYLNTIGSDEVGTGDFFGPIVVTAAYVSKENISFIDELGVKDSKKLTDEKIKKIIPKLIQKIPYVTFSMSNLEYNDWQEKGYNMNQIKAILHNKVLYQMKQKDFPYEKIVVDQFVYPKKYFEHIEHAAEKVTNITFTTKAESKCASVAAASCISRYIFLMKMEEMNQTLGLSIPKGAGEFVDQVGCEVVKKFGEDKLREVAKLNFKNTLKIKELL